MGGDIVPAGQVAKMLIELQDRANRLRAEINGVADRIEGPAPPTPEPVKLAEVRRDCIVDELANILAVMREAQAALDRVTATL